MRTLRGGGDDYDLLEVSARKRIAGTVRQMKKNKNSICVLGRQQYFCCGIFFFTRCEVDDDDTVCSFSLSLAVVV